MSMYGYDVPFCRYDFSDPAFTTSLYGNLIPPMAAIDYDDYDFGGRRPPPPPQRSPLPPSSPPKHRHDGTSPLPLGMDWSLPPRVWNGRESVWPQDSRTGWSYCVTIPSWSIQSSAGGSDSVVFFRVQVGIQSPGGITTTRGVLRRFNEFLKLYSELKKEFPKKNLPPAPPRSLLKMRSHTVLEERRCALEEWVEKLLSDVDVSRTALVAIFLELEAAAISSYYESNCSTNGTVPPDQFPANPGDSLRESNSSVSSEFGSNGADDLGTRPEMDNYAERNIESASQKGVIGSVGRTVRDNSSVNVADVLRDEFAEENLGESNQRQILFRRDDIAADTCCDDGILASSGQESDLDVVQRFPNRSAERDVGSIGSCQTSNFSSKNSLGDSFVELPESAEGLPDGLVVAVPADERHRVNRVLITMKERLGTTKMDMEDLIARLNQEIVVRQYLTTKVKDLEVELETTSQNGKESLQQAILTERERFTRMQWDMEELQRKCMEMELELKTEQDARAHVELMKVSLIEQNDRLLKELNDAKEQVESSRKQHDEVELKSKSDLKLLVKEVKSLRNSHSELKQELSNCLKEKYELEKEKQRWEAGNAAKAKLLDECEVLRNRLRETSVNFPVEEEGKLVLDTASPSDIINVLAISDNRIGLLIAEAQLLAQDVQAATGSVDQDDNNDTARNTNDDELRFRTMVADIFVEDAKLRKQVNAIIRSALSTTDEDVEDAASQTALSKSLDD